MGFGRVGCFSRRCCSQRSWNWPLCFAGVAVERAITPKFSFHLTDYASKRPDVLGSNLPERIIKDYNGQTYWLSVNLHSFFKQSKIPNGLI
jgi:hypothetical protein